MADNTQQQEETCQSDNNLIFNNEVLNIIATRHSKRAFLPDKEVPDEIIEKVLTTAANCPSTQNTQPWGVTVIKGEKLDALRKHMLDLFDSDLIGKPEYENRPSNPTLPEFDEKIALYGKEAFAVQGIDRNNAEQRKQNDRRNFTLFNAPLLLLYHVPKRAVAGTFLDSGLFIQSVLLGFWSFGIGSCPQYSLTKFSDVFRTWHINTSGNDSNSHSTVLLPADRLLVCGISVGYPDMDAPINHFAPSRQAPEKWIHWAK